MGRNKNCIYPTCNSDSRRSEKPHMFGVTFIPFPKPKTKPVLCNKWLKWLKEVRKDFTKDKITKNTYLCNKHFVGLNGPSETFPDPVHSNSMVSILKPLSSVVEASEPTAIEPTQSASMIRALNPACSSTPKAPHHTPMCITQDHIVADSSLNMDETVLSMHWGDLSSVNLDVDDAIGNMSNAESLHLTKASEDQNNPEVINHENMARMTNPFEEESQIKGDNVAMVPQLLNENYVGQICLTDCEDNKDNTNQSSQNDVDMSQNRTCTDNEEWSIKNLKDFLNSPEWLKLVDENWLSNLSNLGNSEVHFLKVNKESNTPLISITITKDNSLQVKVCGKDILNHSMVQLPETISSVNSLIELLTTINRFKICQGIKEPEMVNILKERCRGKVHFSAIRDDNCMGISNNKTCFHCSKLRSYALKTISGGKKTSNRRKYKSLSKEELISLLKKSKACERKARRQVKQEKKKAKKHIYVDSQPLEEPEDNDCIETILTKTIPKKDDQSFVSLFLREQLKAIKQKDARGRRWHPYVIQWCMYQYHKAPNAYKSLAKSKILQLPSYSTLFRHSTHNGSLPGFSNEVFNQLKEDIKPWQLKPHQQYFTILLDEMKVKEELVYKKNTGNIIGYTQLNNARNQINSLQSDTFKEKKVANNVLMLMLRGTTTHEKYPFAHFATNGLTGDDLNSIIWEAVEKLEAIGIKVLGVIGDGAATNRKFFTTNTTVDSPHYCINPFSADEERPFFFMFDPPHLLKTTRNCLWSSEETCQVRLMLNNGQYILWKPIRDLFEKERSQPGNLRKAHKLTGDHIYLNSYTKMKVRYASQVLSKTVAEAIKEEFGEEYAETVKFIEIFDKWFDIFNTTNFNEAYHKRKPNKRPFKTINDQRLSWLENDFLGYLDDWEQYTQNIHPGKFKPEERKKMILSQETLAGLRQSTKAMVAIIKFLLGKGASFVLTGNFNQDPLELEFSKQRGANGRNDNPTIETFGNNRESLLMLRRYKIPTHTSEGNTTTSNNTNDEF